MIGGYHPWFSDELVKRVTEEKSKKAVELAIGAAPDHAAYRYECGFMAGLEHALVIAEEIKRDIEAA